MGFASIELPPGKVDKYEMKLNNFPVEGLNHCGLIAMMDPPKNGVMEAVDVCKRAGIRVMMITGDHPDTAEAIARKVHIISKFPTKNDVAA